MYLNGRQGKNNIFISGKFYSKYFIGIIKLLQSEAIVLVFLSLNF